MKLTKEKAIEISIELWEWLAETGMEKREWVGWMKYGEMEYECPLCELSRKDKEAVAREEGVDLPIFKTCAECPYYLKFRFCDRKSKPYRKWANANTEDACKKYAKLFLAQLKELK